jgi:hypothetical protein
MAFPCVVTHAVRPDELHHERGRHHEKIAAILFERQAIGAVILNQLAFTGRTFDARSSRRASQSSADDT